MCRGRGSEISTSNIVLQKYAGQVSPDWPRVLQCEASPYLLDVPAAAHHIRYFSNSADRQALWQRYLSSDTLYKHQAIIPQKEKKWTKSPNPIPMNMQSSTQVMCNARWQGLKSWLPYPNKLKNSNPYLAASRMNRPASNPDRRNGHLKRCLATSTMGNAPFLTG